MEQFDKIVQLLELNNKLLAQLINAGGVNSAPVAKGATTNFEHDLHEVKICNGKFPPKRTAKDDATFYRCEMFIGTLKHFASLYVRDDQVAGAQFVAGQVLSVKGRLQLDDRGQYTLWTDAIVTDAGNASVPATDAAEQQAFDDNEDVPF